MNNSSASPSKTSLLAARMQGNSQDGYSMIGFSGKAEGVSNAVRQPSRPGSSVDFQLGGTPTPMFAYDSKVIAVDEIEMNRALEDEEQKQQQQAQQPNQQSTPSPSPSVGLSTPSRQKRKNRKDEEEEEQYSSPVKARKTLPITNYFTKSSELSSPVILQSSPSTSSHVGDSNSVAVQSSSSLQTPSQVPSSAFSIASLPPNVKPIFLEELKKARETLADKFGLRQRELESQLQSLQQENLALATKLDQTVLTTGAKNEKVISSLVDTLKQLALKTRHELEQSLHIKRKSIGRIVVVGEGLSHTELWDEGEAVRDLRNKIRQLNDDKNDVEAARKRLQKFKAGMARKGPVSIDDEILGLVEQSCDSMASNMDGDFLRPKTKVGPSSRQVGEGQMTQMEIIEADEVYKLRLTNVKRDLIAFQTQLDDLELQKKKLIKEEKLFIDEAASKFTDYPIIDSRYLFLDMLGKGGFSEVFRAFDLVELRYVACKMHQLSSSWSEERRRNYLKHVVRESNIHKDLNHPKVVKLNDVFKIDSSTLVTVLDLCDEGDLDMYLKVHETLPEKEAKVIILQIFSGLKYINEQKMRIIHYDLKPANILFHKGEAKITDFGLSKQLSESEHSIELTSQGAGTLGYLPPECFVTSYRPHISSAVDIWSCGIIFFQMLFGKRPFDSPHEHNNIMTPQGRAKLILEFPAKPVVSDITKDFIRRCLSFTPTDRPDILSIFEDPFFKTFNK